MQFYAHLCPSFTTPSNTYFQAQRKYHATESSYGARQTTSPDIKRWMPHMPEPREATTEQLSYVIHSMLLAHQTGILKVERSYGNIIEEGTIVFINGQVVQAAASQYRGAEASIDQLRGVEALNRLSEWGFCRFIFLQTSIEELSQLSQRLLGSPNTPPPPRQFSPAPSPHTPPPNFRPGSERRADTRPLSAVTRPIPIVTGQMPTINTPAPPPMGIPYRLQEGPAALQYIEQMKLSRTHRRLFLLIDGKRPAPDLAHLMGKAPEEIYQLLYDLERTGLIKRTETH
jgi:hypothetical protein